MAKERIVTPEDFDVRLEQLKKAAQEGRLFEIPPQETGLSEEVFNKIRSYVGRISSLVTPKYSKSIDSIWNNIFHCPELQNFLKASNKAHKFKDFNKYGVMGIICVLRNNGVYKDYNDSKYDAMLEPGENGSRYRRFLGQGLRQDLCLKVRDIVNKNKL
jgi:hypothetical protein